MRAFTPTIALMAGLTSRSAENFISICRSGTWSASECGVWEWGKCVSACRSSGVSRARRVHRAPHPRASTASLNPAERSAAEIHRESHAQPAGCSRATLGFDIQLSGVRHPRLVRPDRPSARVTSRSRTRAASACFISRDTADTRLTDERLLDRRCARADDSRGSQSCPRLASCSPNPPRGVLSSTHAAPETRVICERFANRGPDHASLRRGTGRVIRRTNDTR